MSEPTPVEAALVTATQVRGALSELADNRERTAEEIRARLAELAQAMDGLCDSLKQSIETTEET